MRRSAQDTMDAKFTFLDDDCKGTCRPLDSPRGEGHENRLERKSKKNAERSKGLQTHLRFKKGRGRSGLGSGIVLARFAVFHKVP